MQLDETQFETFVFGVGIGIGACVLAMAAVVRPSKASATQRAAKEPLLKTAVHREPLLSTEERLVARLSSQFNLSTDTLVRIQRQIIVDMKRGLAVDNGAIKMLPTHVTHRPKGTERGSYLALDLGGTNFRVCEVTFDGVGNASMLQKKFKIEDAVKTGDGEALFDFIAECVKIFLVENHGSQEGAKLVESRKWQLGFCFSFPVNQVSIDEGSLLVWTKGFTASNVVGVNVVKLLQDAFKRQNLNIAVSALVNDTTGTLISLAYTKPNTYAGVILGTGSNCAYVEKVANIEKLHGPREGLDEMLINMEWGGFDDAQVVIPRTKWDHALDSNTPTPGTWTFEQLISGMYLGEVVRLVCVDLAETGELFAKCKLSKEMRTIYAFDTAYMSAIESDHTHDLADTKSILEDKLHMPGSTLVDRRILRTICALVGTRSARLAACGVAAVVCKMNKLSEGCIVGMDGSLFELYPYYK
ncbi:hexokinase-domain-containing protein, partial [Chytriomyces sp. MP71]